MTKLIIYIVIALIFIFPSCEELQQKNKAVTDGKKQTEFDITEFDCDSIYPNKGYCLTLTQFDSTVSEYEEDYNTIFTLSKNRSLIFSDSIHNAYQYIDYKDFNGDGIKDILIQNRTGARSNWSYNLYLVDILKDKIKRVSGFEEILNPNYLPDIDIIDNYVLSGKNYTQFYKIQGDSIREFDIQIEDDLADSLVYQQRHSEALKQNMKILGTNR